MRTKTIEQRSTFKKVKPDELYKMYMNSKDHSAIIGSEAVIGKKVGDSFKLWNGDIKGKNLMLVPGRMIVQSWNGFGKKDDDSILLLTFKKVKGGTELHMVHTHVPPKSAKDIEKGWKDYYWKPWKKYLVTKKKKK